MKKRKSIKVAAIIASTSFMAMAPLIVNGQDISVDMPAAIKAMKSGQWEVAQATLQRVTDTYGPRADTLYGGKFGNIYYDKGRMEMKIAANFKSAGDFPNSLKFYNMAKESFGDCRRFPTDEKGVNRYYNKAILYWGQTDQALERYEEAIASYDKFIAERDKAKDSYNVGMHNINQAICHFKLTPAKLDKGLVFLETALKNKEKYKLPDSAIVSAFKDFAAAAIRVKKEQMLVDFVNNNRAAITLDPYKMFQFTPFFRKYASQAFSKNMTEASFALYALMPGTTETLDDLAIRKESLLGYKNSGLVDSKINPNDKISVSQLKKDYDFIKASAKSGDPHELLAFRSLANTHETEGYPRGAYAAYEMLELYYNKSKDREDNLFNLVRTSSLVGEVMNTEKFGRRFLELFPESKYKDKVRSMMLISLFYSGEYEVALKVATDILPDLTENTKQHDLALHVKSGSLYYLGKFFDGHKDIVLHVKMYPKSDYKIAARFFEASNLARMQNWDTAAPKLDKFLADYPDASTNIYIPFALYDRANAHFAAQEYEGAVAKIERIEKEFPGSPVEDVSMNLRGDVLRSDGNIEESKKYYIKGMEVANMTNNKVVSGESLYKLVALLGQETVGKDPNPNVQDAIPFYDQFWKDYQDSPYKAQVAVSGVPALMAAKRGEEALTNVQVVISEMAKQERAAGMEGAINTYGKYYLQSGKTPEELKAHFEDFPDIDNGDKRARALLSIAVIGVYEDLHKDAIAKKDEETAKKLHTKIEVLFEDMNTRFDVDDLSDFILIRLGDFVAKTDSPEKALKYYDKIIENGRAQFKVRSQFGRAGILAKSNDASKQLDAKKVLEEVKVHKDSDKKTKDSASFQLVELYTRQQDWASVIAEAKDYNQQGYKVHKKEVAHNLAIGLDKTGDKVGAMAAYNAIYNRYKSEWKISVPALTRAAELTREVGKADLKGTSPKQIAYNMAARFIKGSAKTFVKFQADMTTQEVEAYQNLKTLVEAWEGEAGITSLKAQQKALQPK